MPRRYWIYAAVFVLVLALAAVGAWQRAGAQSPGNYDCDVTLQPSGAFDAHCELSEPDEPEATVTGTATATLTLRPTSTPTVTPRPATATPVPVTATATATHTPAAAGALSPARMVHARVSFSPVVR